MSKAPRGRSDALTKMCAILLLALVVSPFTAPFQTCDLTDGASGIGAYEALMVTPPTVAHTSLSDGAGLLVPTLTTAIGRLRLAPVSALAISNFVAASAPVADFALPVRLSPHLTGSSASPTVLQV
jgi:hypothetical protein